MVVIVFLFFLEIKRLKQGRNFQCSAPFSAHVCSKQQIATGPPGGRGAAAIVVAGVAHRAS